MALTMLARDDPATHAGRAVTMTAAAGVFTALAGRVFWPLVRGDPWALAVRNGQTEWPARSARQPRCRRSGLSARPAPVDA